MGVNMEQNNNLGIEVVHTNPMLCMPVKAAHKKFALTLLVSFF